MKTRQFLTTLLMGAMTVSLSMGVTSCKDDDKNDNGGDAQSEAQYEQQQQGWDIITQLSDERLAPEGWEQRTFEPTIGTAKEGDPYTRVVMTNDVATAASRYSALTGASVDKSAASHTFSLDGVGTLTYQRGSESDEYLGQVTVNIKQMPHLKKILYQNAQQSGQNATFAGSAYYRFGDVIQDAEGSYWICVRPSFGPEGKGDSHWMNVTTKLSEKNLFKYEYKGKSWSVPTGLGSSTEHMQNLVEMLFAMLKPADWLQNLSVSPKPTMFHDFSTSRIKYHNIYFWQRVCKAWEENKLFSTIFNESKDEMANILANEDINFIYNGYSWYTKTSWNCQLFQATYKNGTGKQANMHNVTYTKPTKRMENLSVDFSTRAGGVNGAFFDNDSKLRLIVRYKTGKQLSTSGTYDAQTAISGCKMVYVYNSYFYAPDFYDLNLTPEETTEEMLKPKIVVKPMSEVAATDIGKVVAKDGNIYETVADAEASGTQALAMICYMAKGKGGRDYQYVDEKGNAVEKLQFDDQNAETGIEHAAAISLAAVRIRDVEGSNDGYEKTMNASDSKWYVEGATWDKPLLFNYLRAFVDCADPSDNIKTTIPDQDACSYFLNNYITEDASAGDAVTVGKTNVDFSAKGFWEKMIKQGVVPTKGPMFDRFEETEENLTFTPFTGKALDSKYWMCYTGVQFQLESPYGAIIYPSPRKIRKYNETRETYYRVRIRYFLKW